MRKTFGTMLCRVAATFLAFCLVAGSGFSQQPTPDAGPDLTALFNKALTSFAGGDYQASVSTINALLPNVPKDLPPPDLAKINALLEPIYFTLGAAHFNLKDYPAAQAALQDYIKRYPKSARAPEATLSLAQSSFFSKDFDTAAKTFASLETNPAYREQALYLEGASYKEAGKLDLAIAALEKLTNGGITSPMAARGGMQLIRYYSEKKQTDKAFKMLANVQTNIAQVENVVELNGIALAQGDAFLEGGSNEEALTCYRAVRNKTEVVALQKDRLAALQAQLDKTRAAIQADIKNAAQYFGVNKQLQDSIAEDKELLDAFEKLPSIRSKLLYRMGRALDGADKPWESVVAYLDADRFAKDGEDREPALFALASAYAKVNRVGEAQAACKTYLQDFPQGPNASMAGYLLGATALQDNDPKAAEGYFGRMLVDQPASTMREEIIFLLANAKFSQGKFAEAEGDYRKYLTEFPQGTHLEEATYRPALCSLFGGDYAEALKRVEGFLAKYPQGPLASDALYRRAVCLYAAQEYPQVLAACGDWLKQFPTEAQRAEVYSLQGDALVATDKGDEAVEDYVKSYQAALQNEGEAPDPHDDEVLNYALGEASKILQKRGDWTRIDDLYTAFIKEHPQHPTAVLAATWVGRAKTKLGKPDEAKQFVAGFAKKYIDDPKREAVEQLLGQLATMCLRKKPVAVATPTPTPADAAASPAPGGGKDAPPTNVVAAAPAPTPAETPSVDPGAELDALLGAAEQDRSPTARARVLYAKAELARLRRQPAEADRNLLSIAHNFKPDVLSPVILGRVGDVLVAGGKLDEAAPYYQRLMEDFPKSDVVDFAYNGLGEIAFQKKQYQKAYDFFNDATEKIPANLKLKDVTVGQAKALLELGKYDESKKLFEQVAGVREWRGETTAYCVYSLGEIEARQQHWPEANAYFQRVFVAYQKFLPWVAKAYIGSGESFEKLDKKQEAINTYREMLRNERLADLPETAAARARLTALGAG